jgi:hypothetical protein
MRCAACGHDNSDPSAAICPNCGQRLPVSTSPTPEYATPPSVAEPLMAPQYPVPPYPATPYPMTPPPAMPGPYSQPMMPPAMPGYYSQPLAPPAPGSMPLPQGSQPPRLSSMLAPLPPVRKRRFRAAVPIIAGIVVAAAIFGLLVTLTGQENNFNGTPKPTDTTGPGVAYQNTFAQSADGWNSDQHCFFGAGGYHVAGAGCLAPAGYLKDVDVKATVTQISGPTTEGYGLIIRNAGRDERYDVDIDSNSKWVVSRCTGPLNQTTALCSHLVPFTPNLAIHGGLNARNTIEVAARGSHFDVSVNGVSVGSFNDTNFAEGQVGLVTGDKTEAVFTNFVVTQLD